MAERYRLTAADVDGCRRIVAKLDELDRLTGGYQVGHIQGHPGSATATVHYDRRPGPAATSDAISFVLENAAVFGLLAKKIVAHAETHPETVAGPDHGGESDAS